MEPRRDDPHIEPGPHRSLSDIKSARVFRRTNAAPTRGERQAAAGGDECRRPGAWIQWTLRRELDWPADVDVELEIRYAPVDPIGARLVVKDETGRELGSREYR